MNRADIDEDELTQTLHNYLPEDEGVIMTVGQQIEQRGMQQGMHLKSSEIAKKMLLKGMSIDIIMETTDLDVVEIKALQKELEPTKH